MRFVWCINVIFILQVISTNMKVKIAILSFFITKILFCQPVFNDRQILFEENQKIDFENIITIDFDQDGDLDFLTYNYNQVTSDIYLVENKSNGQEWAVNHLASVDHSFYLISIGDLELDGDLDLLIKSNSNQIKLIYNNEGVFDKVRTIDIENFSDVHRFEIVNVDDDNDSDILVVLENSDNNTNDVTWIEVNENDETEFFQILAQFEGFGRVEFKDINNDKEFDFCYINYLENSIDCYINNQQGSFVSYLDVNFSNDLTIIDFQVLDINQNDLSDFNLEFATSFLAGGDYLYYWYEYDSLSNGLVFMDTMPMLSNVTVLDIDDNGTNEIIGKSSIVYEYDSVLNFKPTDICIQNGRPGHFFTKGFLNNDSITDLILTYGDDIKLLEYNSNNNSLQSSIILNDDNFKITNLKLADIDKDVEKEIVIYDQLNNQLLWFNYNKSGKLLNGTVINNTEKAIANYYVIDFNGDTFDDIIVNTNNTSCNNYSSEYVLYINQQNGTFANPITLNFDGYIYDVYDLESDGDDDILLVKNLPEGQDHSWQVNKGDGVFVTSPTTLIGYDGTYSNSKQIIDVNNDGILDIAISIDSFEDDTIQYFIFDKEGNNSELKEVFLIPNNNYYVGSFDLDCDNIKDIISIIKHNNETIWFKLDQNGNVVSTHNFGIEAHEFDSYKFVDIDFDGDIDLIYASSNQLYWRENDGKGNFASAVPILYSEGLSSRTNYNFIDIDLDYDYDVFHDLNQLYGNVVFFENTTQKFVNQKSDHLYITIQPNPILTTTRVELGEDIEAPFTLRLINIHSGLVERVYNNQYANCINIEKGNLSKGIYFLEFIDKNGHRKLGTKKLAVAN